MTFPVVDFKPMPCRGSLTLPSIASVISPMDSLARLAILARAAVCVSKEAARVVPRYLAEGRLAVSTANPSMFIAMRQRRWGSLRSPPAYE